MTALALAMLLVGLGAHAEPLAPPTILAPRTREASFGHVAGIVSRGTKRVVVVVDGKRRAAGAVSGRRFRFSLALPARDVAIRVTAVGATGRRASSTVRPVFGLPSAAEPAHVGGFEDRVLAHKLRALVRRFDGTSAVFVQDLGTGAGAAWNARARFPAGSTLKLAVAVEVLRVLRARPRRGSELDRLLRDMLVDSDNAAANRLETWLGGSVPGGAAKVTATMRILGLAKSRLYGGFLPAVFTRRPIPLTVEREPSFGVEKHTTAWDLARLHRYLHLAAGGTGPLVDRLPGAFTPADARFLLFTLAHSADRGKLDRLVRARDVAVPHKAGWIEHARHDAGIVYWREGAFVAAVMTWSGRGVGASADVLAGRVARIALERFRETRARASLPPRRFLLAGPSPTMRRGDRARV